MKKLISVILSILLGAVSGYISSNSFGGGDSINSKALFFVPGIYFGIAVCLMLFFIFKKQITLIQSTIFIIGSTASYFLAVLIEVETPTASFLTDNMLAGLVGGIGVCLSFAVFKIKLRFENLILIIISILASIDFQYTLSKLLFNSKYSLFFMLWQSAMMGCLIYFALRKMEEKNKITTTS